METPGIASLSRSQVSELAKELDEMVTDFRNRPLDAGPYTYVWADALTMKVREGGRIVNIACLVAPVSTEKDTERSSVSTWPPLRTGPADWRSSVPSSLGASPECSWSSPTTTPVWSTPSQPHSLEHRGNGAAPII